jgi:hypothetical protein
MARDGRCRERQRREHLRHCSAGFYHILQFDQTRMEYENSIADDEKQHNENLAPQCEDTSMQRHTQIALIPCVCSKTSFTRVTQQTTKNTRLLQNMPIIQVHALSRDITRARA